jgi:hypothetical protein
VFSRKTISYLPRQIAAVGFRTLKRSLPVSYVDVHHLSGYSLVSQLGGGDDGRVPLPQEQLYLLPGLYKIVRDCTLDFFQTFILFFLLSRCMPSFMKANDYESCKILLRAHRPNMALYPHYEDATALGGPSIDVDQSSTPGGGKQGKTASSSRSTGKVVLSRSS